MVTAVSPTVFTDMQHADDSLSFLTQVTDMITRRGVISDIKHRKGFLKSNWVICWFSWYLHMHTRRQKWSNLALCVFMLWAELTTVNRAVMVWNQLITVCVHVCVCACVCVAVACWSTCSYRLCFNSLTTTDADTAGKPQRPLFLIYSTDCSAE